MAVYKKGKPLHLSDPDRSAFVVMTETEYEAKTVQEIQEIFRRKHILITEIPPSPPLQFNEEGLSTLAALNTITHIQGQ
jgi:hypothetical protein